MATLLLNNINKRYDNGFHAVQDFNLSVEDQEFIALVGPSGCGKSTLLRMIAGLEDISSGEFYIDERLVNDVEAKDRDIAMVFQSYALYPHMTVYDNMAFALKLRKFPKDEIDQKVKEAAKILGLDALLNRKPKALSGGQRQRVALGRTIVRSPKVFLMDEPLSNLDAKLRGNMRAEIIRIHKTLHATTIYVTHDQTEAMTMADRIVVMKAGVVQQIGSPKEIYNTPNNLFVAGFIGAPTMNFIHGRIENGQFIAPKGTTLAIPEQHYQLIKEKGFDNKDIILGIRPENISNDPMLLGIYQHSMIHAYINVAELLGAEYILHTDIDGEEIKAIVHARQNIKMEQVVNLAFDMKYAHFFDPQTEKSLLQL
ncbi:sn-glycerol-3-phosphate ABC transporter ATP-binding protein UgpC [Pasteurella canis]|uniref:Putrescine/spermidine ABC transporter ATPase n=1 Tax=Pasteurella canis TaxID=753 RepID=A0A379EWM5_9PAST|nr:sn-glycerol-3-phosphate ABC transporter ATP-binding protein UgpC [Pasteurella canis]MXN89520.1 sn-glycerol-3-phosphate ABC transporter ATP-binding protein UgpC [Pasteurella canis]UAY77213.1 sn-glycerol-3-phosphate ABC transporter ATP-binding protein UgpC [Pasteurella canis]UDW83253.1 sn-glycerol-3-phosphate ABC transporter ATP-binding protein UgpC [Pasteurella canis]UEC22778.1 sn-glycerol-3-phosphate ABC transporter ATP-binding protein UgpC [Pasteurella canis]SPY38459.1 putrescine/spermidin